DNRQQHRADPVDMDQRIERDTAEGARRRIAEPVGGPGVGGLVNRERQQEYAEADGDGDGIDVQRLVTAILSILSEGRCPSDSPTRALGRRCAGSLRARGSLAAARSRPGT